ncbi:hypothetical protein JCM3765_002544 [Sporobolomyces pararoseus]
MVAYPTPIEVVFVEYLASSSAPQYLSLFLLSHFSFATDSTVSHPEDSSYGYVPSIAMGVVFIVIFTLTLILHTVQVIISRRMWFMVCMSIGALGEVIGWIFRLVSHYKPSLSDTYIGQNAILVISPAFISASLYWGLAICIELVAPRRSLLSAKAFKITFLIVDYISLVVQGVGGGIAGSATTERSLNMGSNIMLGGIAFQLLVMIVYVIYGSVWTYRAREEVANAGKKMRQMLFALFAASVCVIIRGIFRTCELQDSFTGYLATHEYFILIDAIPIAICSFVLNLIHPAWFLKVQHPSQEINASPGLATLTPPSHKDLPSSSLVELEKGETSKVA